MSTQKTTRPRTRKSKAETVTKSASAVATAESVIEPETEAVVAAEACSEDDYFTSLLQDATAASGSGEAGVPDAPPLVSLSAAAADKVRALLAQEADAGLGLRVFVAGGGCSGLQYGMTLDEEQDGDSVITHDAIRVLVDEMSAQYLAGSEIDYVDSLMGAGFTVNNPNAVSTCGCGHSFKTASDSGAARGCGCGH